MQENTTSPLQQGADVMSLLDYLEVIVNHKVAIICTSLVTFIISLVVSLMLPKVYSSTTLFLPPQQSQGVIGMMAGQMGGMASLANDLFGTGSPADMYVSMLSSDAISDPIVNRFNLMDVYGSKYRVDAYNTLHSNVDISVGKKDGIISITVQDKDPKRAAEIANAYVEELGKLTVRLNSTGAGQDKSFLDGRLLRAKANLGRAEDALKNFQSKNKIVAVNEQAQATIGGIAQLKAQLALQQVQLATLRQQFTDNNQEVKNAKSSITNLNSQIAQLEGTGNVSAIPGVGSVPGLREQYLRLMREFKIQETLVELLTKQSEMAKLSEAYAVTGVQVIQTAQIPEKKIKPKRSFIVLLSTFTAAFVSVFYAFSFEACKRMSPEKRQRLNRICTLFIGDNILQFCRK